jgi:hypothetical protein
MAYVCGDIFSSSFGFYVCDLCGMNEISDFSESQNVSFLTIGQEQIVLLSMDENFEH